jgi:hypothetical protein
MPNWNFPVGHDDAYKDLEPVLGASTNCKSCHNKYKPKKQ